MPYRPLRKGMDFEFGDTEHNSVNSERSFRSGRSVYYNPADSGPYIDGADAFADVPPGGTFILAAGTDYDVPTEGRLVASQGVTIRGEGWTSDQNLTTSGSLFVNTGADAVDEPVIEFSTTDSPWHHRGLALYNLSIRHEGPTSAAVYINNSIRNTIEDCQIHMNRVGSKGIETANGSFFTRIYRSFVTRFRDYGLHLKGGGGGGGVIGCHVSSSVTDAVATRVEREGIRITGGQHSADGAGISFHNTSGSNMRGGYVDGHIWFEHCTDGIRVDGDTHSFNDIVIVNPRTSLDPDGMGVENLANLGRANNTQVLYPNVFRPNSGGNLATLSADTQRPVFVGDYANIGPAPVADNGAALPLKVIQNRLTDGYISAIDTSIPVWVALRQSSTGWSPAFHDGTSWKEQSSANTEFTP